MNETPFRVLSIDFDFFQKATKEQISHYPDGIDVPTELSQIIWASHYITPGSNIIKNVKIDMPFYQQIQNILQQQNPKIPVMITNSHVHAYHFILEHYDNKPIALCNIDLHDDILNGNEKLDCGNWIQHVLHKCKVSKFCWIAKKLSMECYNIKQHDIQEMHMKFDFEEIKDKNFDAIFLCRSDPWTPPHLDTYFANLVDICSSHFENIKAEKAILKPRDMSEILKIEKQIQNMIKNNT